MSKSRTLAIVLGCVLLLLAIASRGPRFTQKADSDPISTAEVTSYEFRGEVFNIREVISNDIDVTAQIVDLIPERTVVESGDVVGELNVPEFSKMEQELQIAVVQAEFDSRKAIEEFVETEKKNETRIAHAERDMQLAKLALSEYQNGEMPLRMKELEGKVALAEERLMKFLENHSEDSDDSAVELKKMHTEVSHAKEKHRYTVEFTMRRELAMREADAKESERKLEREKLIAKARETFRKEKVSATQTVFEILRKNHQRLRDQIRSQRLIASTAGEVVFSNPSIQEGAMVRPRESIVEIYEDLTDLKVRTWVPEEFAKQIKLGQQVEVIFPIYDGKSITAQVSEKADKAGFHAFGELRTALVILGLQIDNFIPRPGSECIVSFSKD